MIKHRILNLFNNGNSQQITIGGGSFTPQPLSLEETMELVLLLAPYIGLIENHLSEFNRIIQNTSGDRPQLLSTFLTALVDEIKPADFTKMFAILLRKEPEWFRDVKAQELIDALPILDDVNNFGGLIASIRALGLTVRYKENA